MQRRTIYIAAGIAVLIPLTIFSYLGYQWYFDHALTDAVSADNQAEPQRSQDRVELAAEKFASANVQLMTIGKHPLQKIRTLPGKLDYRFSRRVDLKAPVDSVVQQILAKPGDAVSQGTRLAMLDSPEIGLVRAEVEKNKAELEIARQARDWADQVEKNLDDLTVALKAHPKPQDIEKEFEERLLGEHRQHVLAAYSRYQLANELQKDIQTAVGRGAVSATLAKQRESAREVANSEYHAATEQSRFDAKQKQAKTKADEVYAARLLDVSRQKLKLLLGANSEFVEIPEANRDNTQSLTRYYLIAPIEGTIEQRSMANSQRISAGTSLYVVANTSSLQIEADLRERDWQALTLTEGQKLRVKVPALNDREFTGSVDYVGRAVSPETQAVPLVGVLPNPQKLLKPGMFVWVSVPLGETQESLAVPPSALMTHEGKKFVFVEEKPRVFRRVDVTTGMETQQWVAITRGLQPNQRVVARGAFLLKSELLLEPDAD